MLRNQRGSTLVIGLIFMAFMGIIASGLVFSTSSSIHLMSKNKSALEAQYAAEAGAIRAKSGLLNGNTDWSWLKNSRPIAQDTTKTYFVSVKDTASNNDIAKDTAAKAGATYTITSTGSVDGVSKIVITTVTLPSNNFPYAIYNGGERITVDTGFHIVYNGKQDQEGFLSVSNKTTSITNNAKFPLVTSDFEIPTIPVSLDATAYQKGSKLTQTLDKKLDATKGTYYAGNGLNMNGGSSISATGGGEVIIFVKNGLNISGNLATDTDTTLVIITDGSLNINGGLTLNGNIKIYAQGDIQINSGTSNSTPNNYMLIMSNGSVNVNSGVTLNKAVIIAQKDFTIGAGNTITGAVIVGGSANLHSATINYDPNVLTNWGKQN